MITSEKTLENTDTVPGIAGRLHEPHAMMSPNGEGMLVSYHWETESDQHTFLHMTMTRSPSTIAIIARTNVDSSEIRGQGDAIWQFTSSELQRYSDSYGIPIIHMVNTNEASDRLPANDPRYMKMDDDGQYCAVFEPMPQD